MSVPASNWTFDNLGDYATRLTVRSGGSTQHWGYAAPYLDDFTATNDFNSILNSFGGSYVDAANQKANFAGPEGIAALEWLVNLVRSKQVSPLPWPEEWTSSTPPMGRGRGFLNAGSNGVAMIPLETGGLKAIEQAASFRFQLVPPPRQVKMADHASAGSWFIVKGAPHREAAVEFIRFASLPEELVRWALEQERIPPHEAAAARPEWLEYEKRKPAMAVFREAARGAVTYPAIGGWGDARAAVGKAIADSLNGVATPRGALEDAARVANASFERARNP
jgi:sn-glycerol 3-phosphate transport system substrate-binding protein